MKLRRSLYARPEIIRGQQCAEARLSRRSDRASYPARQQAVSRRQMAPPPSRHGRQAPQAQSTGTPLGGPARGRWAWWPRRCGCRPSLVSVSTSSASGRRPASGADVQSPRVSVHTTGVQSPVRASERPSVRASGVRRPVSAGGRPVSVRSRVRCVRPGEVVEAAVGRQPRGWDGRGRRTRRRVHDRLVGTGGWRLRRPCWTKGGVGLDSAVVVGGGGAVRGRPRGRPGWAACARGSPRLVGSRGWQRSGDYAPWSSCAGQGRVAWSLRASWAGLRLELAAVLRPQPAVSAARSRLAAL
jgi:hypothetical protein